MLGVEDDPLPAPLQTALSLGIVTYYFRRHFTLNEDPANATVELTMLVDDGAVVYVNGVEVRRLGLPQGDIAFDTRANRGVGVAALEGPFAVPPELLVTGDNVIAVEVHQISPSSADLVFGLTLDGQVTATSASVAAGMALLDGLRVTEIMYNPAPGQEYEFVELQNVGSGTLDLAGVRLGGGIEFTFPPSMLGPGKYVVVVGNQTAFESVYGGSINVAGEFGGRLSNGGDTIDLLLPEPYEAAVLRIEYDDAWYPLTDGPGHSLVIVDPAAAPRVWNVATGWRESWQVGGSPGEGETWALPGDYDRNGRVDVDDYLLWLSTFGQIAAPPGAAPTAISTAWSMRPTIRSGGTTSAPIGKCEPRRPQRKFRKCA